MSSHHFILLFLAAAAGGTVNSVAGGGGFIAFPSLLFSGVPSINANATGTVALWPGTLASTGAYRKALSADLLKQVLPLVIITFLGSVVGSVLLLKTRQSTFDKMIPWLLLCATLLFCFSGKVTAWINRHHSEGGLPSSGVFVGSHLAARRTTKQSIGSIPSRHGPSAVLAGSVPPGGPFRGAARGEKSSCEAPRTERKRN